MRSYPESTESRTTAKSSPESSLECAVGPGTGLKISRREALRIGLGTLLSLQLWPGRLSAEASAPGAEFTFIAVNDLHYREAACGPWFEKTIKAMKQSAPGAEFCLVGGDLSDNGTEAQLTGIRAELAKLGIPFHAVLGNHDHRTHTDRAPWEKVFSGQINHAFEHRGWQVIGLDSTDGTKSVNTRISPATFAWLDENLPKLDPRKPTVLFTHFPLGAEMMLRPLNAEDLLARFLEFNLRAVYCGHWHGFSECRLRDAAITTDRCCSRVRGNADGSKEKGWFVCKVSGGAIARRFVALEAV